MFNLPLNQKRHQILHVDADAFFASVEQVLNPKLKGKPVLVGDPSGKKGIVAAASYEARKFGIHSAMPMYLAKQKCPQAIVVGGHYKVYRDFSQRMYKIFEDFTPHVEMVSIDEAFLDLSGCDLLHKKTTPSIAKTLIFEIYRKLGLTVSCGLASSKTVAKVASSQNKPHKLTIVPFGKEKDFLAPLNLRALPGIGPRTFITLERFGFRTIGDLSCFDLNQVLEKFGIHGIPLWKKSMGIDNSPVIAVRDLPKSISKERTFYNLIFDKQICLQHLKDLSERVFKKLRIYEMRANTVFIKIRYLRETEEMENKIGRKRLFEDFSFQKHLSFPTNVDNKLFPLVRDLFLENAEDQGIRLLGIGVNGLIQKYNLSLFERDEHDDLFVKIDAVKDIYGEQALRYGV